MCNDRSWKTCSIATIVFSSLLMLGMFIGVGVMNAMFGENMRCYSDITNAPAPSPPPYGVVRREMFEEMHHIAAQHPSGDGVARVKLALSNIAHTFGLGPAIKQLPAVLALSPEGRKLTEAIPNDDSCGIWASDGDCDDGAYGFCDCGTDLSDCGYRYSSDSCGSISLPPPSPPYNIPNDDSCGFWASDGDCDDNFLCDCGTDVTDCGFRSSTSDCSYRSKTVDESVEEIEKAVLDVFNPCIIVPAIVCALFLYLGSGLTLCKPACGGMAVLISGAVFSLLSLPIFSIMVFIYLFYANILIEIYKTSFNFGGDCSGSAAESNFCKCIDDSQAMFSSAGVGCLIACIGCLGAFISAICASCGICKAQKKAKAASLPGPGTQMGAVQGVVQAVAVAQPMAVAQPL